MGNVEEKILEINKLAEKFKLSWSICHFRGLKNNIKIYVSPGNWEDEESIVIQGKGLIPCLQKTIKELHQKYLD